MAMAGKMEKRMTMDCGRKSPGWLGCFPASHGTSKKSRNVENRDIDFVNE